MSFYISIFKKDLGEKNASLIILSLVVLAIFFVSVLVYLVDPYQYFHKTFFSEVYFSKKQRYQVPGLIKHYPVKNYIVGTSMSENFSANEAQQVFGTDNFQQITISGLLPKNFSLVMEFLLSSNQPDIVIMDVHWYFESLDPNEKNKQHDFPDFLYSNNIFDKQKYLFNHDIVKESLKRLFGVIDKKNYSTDFDSLNHWMKEELFIKYNKSKNLELLKKKLGEKRKTYNIEELMKRGKKFNFPSIEENLVPFIKNNPNTKFLLFFPPYSTWYYASTEKKNFMNRLIYMRKYVADNLSHYNNVEVFGFDLNYFIVNDIKNYKDYGHYHKWVNSFVLKSIKNGENKITNENSSNYIQNMVENINKYNM